MRDPFDRPMRIGDRQQIRALAIMNGEFPYCPACYTQFDPDGRPYGEVDMRCPRCWKARLEAGAAMDLPDAPEAEFVSAAAPLFDGLSSPG